MHGLRYIDRDGSQHNCPCHRRVLRIAAGPPLSTRSGGAEFTRSEPALASRYILTCWFPRWAHHDRTIKRNSEHAHVVRQSYEAQEYTDAHAEHDRCPSRPGDRRRRQLLGRQWPRSLSTTLWASYGLGRRVGLQAGDTSHAVHVRTSNRRESGGLDNRQEADRALSGTTHMPRTTVCVFTCNLSDW